MNNDSHQDWDDLFNQLPVDTTPHVEQLEKVKHRALGTFDRRTVPRFPYITLSSIAHTLMKYKVPHGVAATMIVACAVWLIQSASTPALALDLLIEKLMQAESARFETIVTVEGHSPQKMKGFYLAPAHMRQESDGSITIVDWATGKSLALDPKTKRATELSFKNLPGELKNGLKDVNWFEGMRQALRVATKDPTSKVQSLGEQQFGGKVLVGIRIETPGMPMTIWSDPKTQLPVRMESTMTGPPKTEIVLTSFEFNVELDKAMFSVEIPQGYTVADVTVDLSPPSESELIAALRMCTEVSNGEFPSGFDAFSMGKYAATYVHRKGLDKQQGTADQQQVAIKIARGFQFVLLLPREADAHYARTQAKFGDAERAVLWYKPTGSDKYRVIYADLTVREANEMPAVVDAVKLSK